MSRARKSDSDFPYHLIIQDYQCKRLRWAEPIYTEPYILTLRAFPDKIFQYYSSAGWPVYRELLPPVCLLHFDSAPEPEFPWSDPPKKPAKGKTLWAKKPRIH